MWNFARALLDVVSCTPQKEAGYLNGKDIDWRDLQSTQV